ncbi:MAG: GtrA family protein [Anaerolineae bacterium]
MSQLINAQPNVSLWGRLLHRLSEMTGLPSQELIRFLKFATVGAIGMIVDLTVLNVLHKAFGLPLLVANTFSFTIAVLSNFTWNRLWTFPESRQRPLHTQLVKFALVNLIGLAINNLVLWTAHLVTQRIVPDPFDYNLAKIIAIGVVLFWNYGANRLWTYKGIS